MSSLKCIEEACLEGNWKKANWILSANPSINLSENDDALFVKVCSFGLLRVAQWMLSVRPSILQNADAFRPSNNFDVDEWLVSVKPDIDVTKWGDTAFNNGCCTTVRYLKWMLQLNPSINVLGNSPHGGSLKVACCNHHKLDIVKFLMKLVPDMPDEYVEVGFARACGNHNLKTMQYLFSVRPTLNVSFNNEYAFRYACCNGDLPMVQWLLSVKPSIDISANNNDALHRAFDNNHKQIVQLLCSMKPELLLMVYNNSEEAKTPTARWVNMMLIRTYDNASAEGDLSVVQRYALSNWSKAGYLSDGFRWACEHGQLEVAKWMHSIGLSKDAHPSLNYPDEINDWIRSWCI